MAIPLCKHSRTQTQAVVLISFSVGFSYLKSFNQHNPSQAPQGLNNPTQDTDECLFSGDSRSFQAADEHEPLHMEGR